MNLRSSASSVAQFTQEDPIGLAGGLNLYGFAGGDPINFSDPFGLRTCPPDCGILHAVAGAAFGTLGALVGAGAGATAGTLALPGGGTISGGVVGGWEGAVLGAGFGVGVVNVSEVLVEGLADLVSFARWKKDADEDYEELEGTQRRARTRGYPEMYEDISKAKQKDKARLRTKAQEEVEKLKDKEGGG